jgi:hypothetical protein
MREKNLLLLVRINKKAVAMMRIDKQWLLNVFEPPYTVPMSADDGDVVIEQDVEQMAESIGVRSAAEDILQGRLQA